MRVLIVEDEFMVASALELVVSAMGHQVVGSVPTVATALSLLAGSGPPDVAILDLNLRGESSEPVAEELARRLVPFVFATGYDADSRLRQRFPAAVWLHKPYAEEQIRSVLADLTPTVRS